MRPASLLLASLAVLTFAAPLTAQETPATSDPVSAEQPKPAKKPKEKRICRKQEALSGSRMGLTVCKTAAEWAAQDEAPANGAANSRSGRSYTN